MGLISKTVNIIPKSKQVTYFKKLGYTFNKGDKIEVKVSDLSSGSRIPVDCVCDYCNKPFTIPYKEYKRRMNGIIKKISCTNCKGSKTTESNMLVYGVRHPSELHEIQERVRETNRSRYGKDYYTQTDEYIERVKATNNERYNMDWNINHPEIREKQHQSVLQHYGVDYTFQSKEIQDKRTKTMIDRYGVENPSKVPEFHEKKKQSCLQTTGYEYALQSPECREKAAKTMELEYGVKNPMQSEKLRTKARETLYVNGTAPTSIQQQYLCELYNGELNYPIKHYSGDIVLKDFMIDIEYLGGGHWLSVALGSETQDEFDTRQRKRFYIIKSFGYKQIEIISHKDYLPSDDVLLQMLDKAKQYFSEYPNHSWVEFNIDKGIMRNAEYMDGVLFDFKQLRKIKKTDLKIA